MLPTSYSVNPCGPLDRVKKILDKPDNKVMPDDLIRAAAILDRERQRNPCDQEIAALYLRVYSLCTQIH